LPLSCTRMWLPVAPRFQPFLSMERPEGEQATR
jgi:hypothetical protein